MKMNSNHHFCYCMALGAWLLAASPLMGLAQEQPSPAVKVELPGTVLVMKPVFLGINTTTLIATRQVILGNREEPTFREWLTRSSLAGSFKGRQGGKDDWLYYLSETEITEAQWAAVMGGPPTTSKLPKTSITYAEVQMFIEKLNAWMMNHTPTEFPQIDGQTGFFRLPTEAEWEFAARGGAAVSEELFNHPYPFPEEDIQDHEWCFDNSRGKIQPCGLLKANPLGLQDMLGNVSEMVGGAYSFEYQQGRQGGFIIRGARYNDPVRQFRASRRAETVQSYDERGAPRRDPEVGFRLALASAIFGDGKELETAWAEYVKDRPTAAPGAKESNSRVIERELVDARQQLENLRTQLAGKARIDMESADLAKHLAQAEQDKRDLLNKVNLLNANLLNASSALRASEKLNASSWVRNASLQSKWLYNSSTALGVLRDMESNETVRKRIADHQANLTSAWTHYQLALKSLALIDQDFVNDAMSQMRTILRDEKLPQQEALLSAISDHLLAARQLRQPSQQRVIADFEKAVAAAER